MNEDISKDSQDLVVKAKNFSQKDFSQYRLSNCIFEQCDFTQSTFTQAQLWNCTFKACNFSLASFKDAQLNNVVFGLSQLVGINFSACDASLLFSINCFECLIQHCTFLSLAMNETSFAKSKIFKCAFTDCQLKNASFVQVDLQATTFDRCNLYAASFKDAKNYIINPCNNIIDKATFSFPECVGLIKSLDITLIE